MRAVRILLAAGAALLAVLAGNAAEAQQGSYPSCPVTMVVPFAAGSGTDAVARVLTHYLGERMGQRFVVDNKPGANGAIAATFVARAAPDGYTLFMTTNTTHSANPFLMKTIAYDPVKDFTPVSRMGNLPFMLVVDPNLPARSVPELIAHAKKNPGKLAFASGNSTGIVAGETLKRMAGLDILHVPYKSTPPAMTDVIGGQVQMMFVDFAAGRSHVESGKLRPLAVTTKRRSALMPELPSMAEAAPELAEFDLNSWNGVFAPAGAPREIVQKLNGEIRQVVDMPEAKKRLAEMGFDAFTSTPEELGEFVNSELVRWSKLIKDAGIEPE